MKFFGEPWPSGVCDDGLQVLTPVGERCLSCDEPIVEGDQGSLMGTPDGMAPIHKECSLREVLGGIGHLENHGYWCRSEHNPDGGRTRRQSAIEVWEWVQQRGIDAAVGIEA